MSTDDANHWRIAAREKELDSIHQALVRGGGALLVGPAGVGKSSLLANALRRAADEGRTVLSVGGASWNSGTRARGFGSLAECLEFMEPTTRGAAHSDHPIVGIDDAHLADPASSDRLHRLVAAGRLGVLATARHDAPAPAGLDRLWVERLVDRIEVAPFDSTALDSVLHARLGGHVDTFTLERLWGATHGNALMLRELVEHALEDGSLRCVDGTWSWLGLTGAPGRRLADVVRVGLRGLDAEENELVHMLALAEPLEAEIVTSFGLAKAAESLDLRGIVRVERSRARVSLRLAVPLSRAVVASGMSDLTAQRLRRELADALENTGTRREEDVLRIISLRLESGLVPPHEQLLAAARTAIRRRDFPLAERLCLVGLQDSPSDADSSFHAPLPDSAGHAALVRRLMTRASALGPAGAGDRVRAALLLGQVLVGKGAFEDADQVLAAGMGTDVPLPLDEYVSAVHTRVINMAWSLRRIADAEAVLTAAVAAVGPGNAGVLDASRAVIAVLSDRLQEAVAIGDEVLGAPDPADVAVAPVLLPTVAFARAEVGDPAGALALVRRYQDASADWDVDARLITGAVSARCSYLLGHLRAAADALDTMHRDLFDTRPMMMQSVLDHARVLRLLGRPEQAVTLLRQTIAAEAPLEYPTAQAWPLAQLAGALAESGRCAEALRTLVEIRAARGGAVPSPVAEDEIAYEHALVRAHSGDRTGAVAQALAVAERARDAGRVVRAVFALHLAARITEGAAVRRPDLGLLEVARRAGGIVEVIGDHIRALAESDGAALHRVSERLRDMGALPLAAEAAAQAARAFKTAGQRRKGREATAACTELLRAPSAVLPPWLTPESPRQQDLAPLTPREREVAALAATGLSNRDIAGRLVVSVRTVENHLHRIYHKLGITARSHLLRGLQGASLLSEGAPALPRQRSWQSGGDPAPPRRHTTEAAMLLGGPLSLLARPEGARAYAPSPRQAGPGRTT
ncbi:LuxR C-terminal-related transcriptional regulator [Streptomyces sp. NPDC058739]|uniref:LuxR C-terminal-related transcriptional regulator n=1 Tax=Streptomyces sp. NPDC058739 TaxID=3346618 RepID=UPI0036B6C665